MRVLQITIVKILSLLTMLGGGLLLTVCTSTTVRSWIEFRLPLEESWLGTGIGLILGSVLGGLIFLVGFMGLLPVMKPKRSKNTISFSGSHGEVTIELDSVEATLARVVNKMPVVKKIWVRVTPSEDNHRAHVSADVWIYKNADNSSAREITNRIMDHLMDTAVNILGVEEITAVDVNVRGIVPTKVSAPKAADEEEIAKKNEDPKPSAEATPESDAPSESSEDASNPSDAPETQGTDTESPVIDIEPVLEQESKTPSVPTA